NKIVMKCSAALAFVLAALAVTVNQVVSCPTGYLEFSLDPVTPVCLRFTTENTGKWTEMREYCQEEGADLAELKGDLHHAVYEYIIDNDYHREHSYWIGGTDASHEGTWVWISSGDEMEMGVPHWYTGEPDGSYWENYCCLHKPDYYFHSCDNDNNYHAICQI
ncbi:hypothetical protein OTU49_000607, partial [Cherax quadricarinatus]